MSYSRFALGFTRNRKVHSLSDAAFRLWVSAIDYAREQKTDGELTANDMDAVPRCPARGRKRDGIVAELVAAGLLEEDGDSWQLHDFHDWQDSAEQVSAKQAAARERMRRVRANRERTSGEGSPNVPQHQERDREREEELREPPVGPPAVAPAAPKPKPKPVRWRKVPESWQPNEGHQKIAADHGVSLAAELPKFRDHEFAQPKSDADACFRTWLRTAAEIGLRRPAPGFVQHQAQTVEASRRPELQLFRPKPVSNPVSADEFARFAGKR
jgi:hypothetical protein